MSDPSIICIYYHSSTSQWEQAAQKTYNYPTFDHPKGAVYDMADNHFHSLVPHLSFKDGMLDKIGLQSSTF